MCDLVSYSCCKQRQDREIQELYTADLAVDHLLEGRSSSGQEE